MEFIDGCGRSRDQHELPSGGPLRDVPQSSFPLHVRVSPKRTKSFIGSSSPDQTTFERTEIPSWVIITGLLDPQKDQSFLDHTPQIKQPSREPKSPLGSSLLKCMNLKEPILLWIMFTRSNYLPRNRGPPLGHLNWIT